ncbi:riboflavin biosynthesis protein RibF [Lactobacillaceae bacterium 24-114]
METIEIHHPLRTEIVPNKKVVLAMGFFDGVHRGHQEVILRAKEEAKKAGLPLAVLTYKNAPAIAYKRFPEGFKYLSTTPRKISLLEQLEVDIVYLINFTSSFAQLSPQEFVDQYLIAFHAQTVVAGFDHTYGEAAVANMEQLPGYAKGRFKVITIPKLTDNQNKKIGSHYIREQIQEGELRQANYQLGYYYQTSGLVVHGFARGRKLGFPTINVETPTPELLPKIGVYAVKVVINGVLYDGMANVGRNITFGDHNKLTVEIYLFDVEKELYGEEVKVYWYQYIRGEEKFANVNDLIKRMQQDEREIKSILHAALPIEGQIIE